MAEEKFTEQDKAQAFEELKAFLAKHNLDDTKPMFVTGEGLSKEVFTEKGYYLNAFKIYCDYLKCSRPKSSSNFEEFTGYDGNGIIMDDLSKHYRGYVDDYDFYVDAARMDHEELVEEGKEKYDPEWQPYIVNLHVQNSDYVMSGDLWEGQDKDELKAIEPVHEQGQVHKKLTDEEKITIIADYLKAHRKDADYVEDDKEPAFVFGKGKDAEIYTSMAYALGSVQNVCAIKEQGHNSPAEKKTMEFVMMPEYEDYMAEELRGCPLRNADSIMEDSFWDCFDKEAVKAGFNSDVDEKMLSK